MRCLQCGKDVPLLKRMTGSEFCSDAHRREYQREYSQLALGRLLQTKPTEVEKASTPEKIVAPVEIARETAPDPLKTSSNNGVPAASAANSVAANRAPAV